MNNINQTIQLSIIIPCYNEEKNIPLILDVLNNSIPADSNDIEVILINNGSTDNSSEVIKNVISKSNTNYLRSVDIHQNQGYGQGILQGLAAARGNILAWTHADMQTDPKDILDAYKLYKKHNNNEKTSSIFIKGKRKNRQLLESVFTWGMQMVVWFILRIYLDDINAQPKLFSKDFYVNFLKNNAPIDFSLDLYALYQAKANHYKILEVPVYFNKRIHGEAKGGGSWKTRIKLIKRTLNYIFTLKRSLQKNNNIAIKEL